MAALTHTFTANTIAVGQSHNTPAASNSPILGVRVEGALAQITRGGGVWELFGQWNDQNIFPNSIGGVLKLMNSSTILYVHTDFSSGSGNFTNSPFAVTTDLVNWTSPSWTDPISGNASTLNTNGGNSYFSVLYDRFILVRTKDILTSTDGVNWTSGALPSQWPYFGNTPGQNNGSYDLVESLVATPGNKMQILISTYLGAGFLAPNYQSNLLESTDYGATWTMKHSFYGYNNLGYVNIITSQDTNFPNTSSHGQPVTGKVTQVAYDTTNNVTVVVIKEPADGTPTVLRSYDSGTSWYSNSNVLHIFQHNKTAPFTLKYGGGYWIMYTTDYPTNGDPGGWFFIQGSDWTDGSGGYQTWTRITINGDPAPNWFGGGATQITFDGTYWIFKDTYRGLKSTNLTTWTAIPMKPKLAASASGESFYGEN